MMDWIILDDYCCPACGCNLEGYIHYITKDVAADHFKVKCPHPSCGEDVDLTPDEDGWGIAMWDDSDSEESADAD